MEQEVQSTQRAKVSPRHLKGLTEEEQEAFITSYKRSGKVLRSINDYATREAEAKLSNIENPKAFEIPNWEKYVAWCAGYRNAMKIIQDLTR